MGGGVNDADLVCIQNQELTQCSPVVAIGLLAEPDGKGCQGEDVVSAQKPDRLPVGRSRAPFCYFDQRFFIGVLGTQKQPFKTSPLVEVQDIRIANDIVRAGRPNQCEIHVLRD